MSLEIQIPEISIPDISFEAPSLDLDMPDLSVPELAVPEIGIDMPDVDVVGDGVAYNGSMEWTVADQAAFEGAVVESNLGETIAGAEEDFTWSPSFLETNLADSQEYLNFEQAESLTPLSASSLPEDLVSYSVHNGGIWLSEIGINMPLGDELSPQLQDSQDAAVKVIAQSLGFGVEDVLLERDGQTVVDSFIHPFDMVELPEEPYQIDGQYFCEGTEITAEEASRVSAARKLALITEHSSQALNPSVAEVMLDTTYHFDSIAYEYEDNRYLIQIDIEKPWSEDDHVDITAKSVDGVRPDTEYERILDSFLRDSYITEVDSAAAEQKKVERATRELEGYDVDEFEDRGGFTKLGARRFRGNFKQDEKDEA